MSGRNSDTRGSNRGAGRPRGDSTRRGSRGGGGGGGRGDYAGRGRGDRGGGGRGDYGGRGGGDRGGGGRGDYGGRGGGGGRGDYRGRGGDRGGRGGPPRIPAEIFRYPDGHRATPDPKVGPEENKIVSIPDLQKLRIAASRPWRPGYGSMGAKVILWANYFEIKPKKMDPFYRYSIQVEAVPKDTAKEKSKQEAEPTGGKLKRTIELFLQGEPFTGMRDQFATDFRSTLVTTMPLKQPLPSRKLQYVRDSEEAPHPSDPTYYIRIIEPQTISVSTLLDYVRSGSATYSVEERDKIVQALNIILGYHTKKLNTIVSQGANRHYAVSGQLSESFPLGGGAIAWRGFFVSVRLATMKILYNVQVKNGAFYEPGSLISLVETHLNDNRRSLVKLNKFLNRVRVELTHLKSQSSRGSSSRSRSKRHIKSIWSLASPGDGALDDSHPPIVSQFGAGPSGVQFWHSQQNKYITVSHWFKTQYQINTSESYPVVNVGNGNAPRYLPVEVCQVLAGQPVVTMLSASQTEQMIRFAIRPPGANAGTIANNSQQMLQLQRNPILESFGMSLSDRLLAVNGRVLRSPPVQYRDNKSANTMNGQWNMRGIRFIDGRQMRNWGCIRISKGSSTQDRIGPNQLSQYLDRFADALQTNGLGQRTPVLRPVVYISNITEANAHREIGAKLIEMQSGEIKPDFILVILPKVGPKSSDIWLYNQVKTLADVKHGLHTICVVDEKFAKDNNDQYFANLALKFNMKLGGRNQGLGTRDLGFLSEGKTMLASLDVTHPSPGSAKTAPSISAMVASIDKHCFQYRAQIRIQDEAGQEMVSGLQGMTKKLLKKWHDINKSYPENIIVYRDGVSEGQYNLVLEKELPNIQAACKELYPADKTKANLPRITVAIVGKRHHVRFYASKDENGVTDSRSKNPVNGTVVDRDVTDAKSWEFYLQAHTAIQGTARSAHYYIIYDEIFKTIRPQPPMVNAADIFESLTHSLCYLFGRATKAVSICPPAYYADLVCDRARRWNAAQFDGTADERSPRDRNVPINHIAAVHTRLEDSMWWV